tara:strand:+ start:481 stop:957 length:477 start_codon:yes stop_codon:yes gene_type:complete
MMKIIHPMARLCLRLLGKIDSSMAPIFTRFRSIRGIAKKVYLFPNSRGGWLDPRSEIKYAKNISIGQRCVISVCTLGAKSQISLGDDVTISKGAVLETGSLTRKGTGRHKSSPIIIGNRVWISANAIVLGGAIIEDDCVIAAGAVFKGHLLAGTTYYR